MFGGGKKNLFFLSFSFFLHHLLGDSFSLKGKLNLKIEDRKGILIFLIICLTVQNDCKLFPIAFSDRFVGGWMAKPTAACYLYNIKGPRAIWKVAKVTTCNMLLSDTLEPRSLSCCDSAPPRYVPWPSPRSAARPGHAAAPASCACFSLGSKCRGGGCHMLPGWQGIQDRGWGWGQEMHCRTPQV